MYIIWAASPNWPALGHGRSRCSLQDKRGSTLYTPLNSHTIFRLFYLQIILSVNLIRCYFLVSVTCSVYYSQSVNSQIDIPWFQHHPLTDWHTYIVNIYCMHLFNMTDIQLVNGQLFNCIGYIDRLFYIQSNQMALIPTGNKISCKTRKSISC